MLWLLLYIYVHTCSFLTKTYFLISEYLSLSVDVFGFQILLSQAFNYLGFEQRNFQNLIKSHFLRWKETTFRKAISTLI